MPAAVVDVDVGAGRRAGLLVLAAAPEDRTFAAHSATVAAAVDVRRNTLGRETDIVPLRS
jgi:hypothetical protein